MENFGALSYISAANLGTSNRIRSSKSGGFLPKPKTGSAPRKGRLCPSCGLERSLAGYCDCNV